MLRNRKTWSVALVVLGVGIGYFAASAGTREAIGQPPPPAAVAQPAGVVQPAPAGAVMATSGPKYTVVQTDILSALVVDNSTNTVYFYTTERDAEPGAELHLRGSLDLNQVGQPVLKPKKAAGAEGGEALPKRVDK